MLTNDDRELLIRARQKISSGECRYICFAMASAARDHHRLRFAHFKLGRYIDIKLQGFGTLEGWLHSNGHISEEQYMKPSYEDHEQARLARLEWIDWMLGE